MSNIERWKPKYNEIYYFVDSDMSVSTEYWNESYLDKSLYASCNCFKTEDEAKAVAEKIKELLKSLHEAAEPSEQSEQSGNTEQLPELVEIGGYIYHPLYGYGKVISGSVKTCYIEFFNGGKGDFVSDAFDQFKQARLRPYSPDEMEPLVGKVLHHDTGSYLVTAFEKRWNQVKIEGVWRDVEELMKVWTWFNGEPCGVLEHLENGEWVE